MVFEEFSWNYSDGIIISAVFLSLAPVWLVTFCLSLNKTLSSGKSKTPSLVKARSSL